MDELSREIEAEKEHILPRLKRMLKSKGDGFIRISSAPIRCLFFWVGVFS
jgi:hypothetical protein